MQKATELLVRYRSDGLVTAMKQKCLKRSFKTMFRITQHNFCRQTVPNDNVSMTMCHVMSTSDMSGP